MPKQKWFDRKFTFVLGPEIFPLIVERLRGTPARIEERIHGTSQSKLVQQIDSRWSIQENIGHLSDLEPLWMGRLQDFAAGEEILRPADLSNTATYQAQHNKRPVWEVLQDFRAMRREMVAMLDLLDETDAAKTALHPRLQQPMRLLDLVYFVAEHDDHHLACISESLKDLRI